MDPVTDGLHDDDGDYLFDARLPRSSAGPDDGATGRPPSPLLAFIDDADVYRLRPLRSSDYDRGYMELLSQLTVTGNVTRQMYANTFASMKSDANTYIIVIEDTQTGRLVASGTLSLEKKFIHSCGHRGRIEDIVVDSKCRGKRFGKIVVQCLITISKILKCYKISLECKDSNVNWYSSMGFIREQGNSNYMQIRFEK